MWEISITSSSKNRHYLVELKKNLIAKFKKDGIICVCEKLQNQYVLSVACFEKVNEIKSYLKQLLIEIIVLTSKEEFMNKNIVMNSVSETCRLSFIKALIYFDYENDLAMLEDKVSMDSNINIEAFGKFKCSELKVSSI